ncbi:uncharacterized protein LOC142559567 [Dermacentor variabilis]|uniref:uncharacterized protein LOC142559567 n=1 Tax=Dermacentor variabilis TaxID=34621 RepID=UPI003F5BBC2E
MSTSRRLFPVPTKKKDNAHVCEKHGERVGPLLPLPLGPLMRHERPASCLPDRWMQDSNTLISRSSLSAPMKKKTTGKHVRRTANGPVPALPPSLDLVMARERPASSLPDRARHHQADIVSFDVGTSGREDNGHACETHGELADDPHRDICAEPCSVKGCKGQ